ncbi:MAG: class I SAM-dependent methyltransferase [Woeseiaceae bacterium]
MLICPNCLSDEVSSGSRCTGCGWEPIARDGIADYFNGSDRASNVIEKYVHNYESLAQQNMVQSNIDRRFLRNQAINLAKYVAPVQGRYICDVGIGQGFLCEELLRRGACRVAAVDVAITYLRRFLGHERVQPYLANAECLPFLAEFDMLVSTDVMEHVINVGSFLYSVNRALKLGGTFAVRVPYREGLLEYSPHRGYAYAFGHLRSFNKDLLRIYLSQAGFRLRSFHLDGFSPGTPQPYLYDTPRRKQLYHRFVQYLNDRLEHPADATLMNSRLARLFMRPVEIAAIAEKVAEVS